MVESLLQQVGVMLEKPLPEGFVGNGDVALVAAAALFIITRGKWLK